MSFNVDGPKYQGRLMLSRKDMVNADLRKNHLDVSLASGRSTWRNAIRPVTNQIALQPTMSGARR